VPKSAIAERREVFCVLRDGVRLRTTLLIPHGDGPWPALLTRHPYDVRGDEDSTLVDVTRFVDAGFLVALQDVRGRYGSEGEFDPSAQEVRDGADAVAWLANLPECTGVVGMWGASYASETQVSALIGGAPALRAIVPAVTPVASSHLGFRFRGGVPEVGSMLAWAHYPIAPDRIARIQDPAERAAELERWNAVDRAFQDGSLFRAGLLSSPLDADATTRWMLEQLRAELDSPLHDVGKVAGRWDALDVPALIIGGWFDVFLGSTLEVYRRLRERSDAGGGPMPHLVIGPWSHNDYSGRLGDIDHGPSASADDLGGEDYTALHLAFFDSVLRGSDAFADRAPVRVFLMGENRWVELDDLPAPGSTERALHLTADGGLAHEPGRSGSRSFVSDPTDPVPTRGGATLLAPPYAPGPFDQSDLDARPDVLGWTSAPLEDDLTVIGPVRAVVHVATTGTDADVVVRLCDEHPDGRRILIADGVQRASARGLDPVTGRGERRPVTPGAIEEYAVDLWATAHVFRRGHRIHVVVTSSSSPRWEVGSSDFPPADGPGAPAELTIHVGVDHPSRLLLTNPPRTSQKD